ncbi:hypothetical protein BDQ17DRAFT_1323944 [Cyathus striatus]|nr:hypothetical protein BDQ17DRAFT_1323944 [Cyathus striatus]
MYFKLAIFSMKGGTSLMIIVCATFKTIHKFHRGVESTPYEVPPTLRHWYYFSTCARTRAHIPDLAVSRTASHMVLHMSLVQPFGFSYGGYESCSAKATDLSYTGVAHDALDFMLEHHSSYFCVEEIEDEDYTPPKRRRLEPLSPSQIYNSDGDESADDTDLHKLLVNVN